MRRAALAAVLATLHCPSIAEGRLFYQTYGATVAAPGGGCLWNVHQDYFVPRHCDSGRYGLLSSCKTSQTTSAACRRGHQIYHGYCSPYGACRYRWRDHVYQAHCGCTKLACYHGPWRREVAACGYALSPHHLHQPHHLLHDPRQPELESNAAAKLEPFGIEVLGTIRADSAEAVAGLGETVAVSASASGGGEESRLPSLGQPPLDESGPSTVPLSTEPTL